MKFFHSSTEFKNALESCFPLHALFIAAPASRQDLLDDCAWMFSAEIKPKDLGESRSLLAYASLVQTQHWHEDTYLTCKIRLHAVDWEVFEESVNFYRRRQRISELSEHLAELKGKRHPKLGKVPPIANQPERRHRSFDYWPLASINILTGSSPPPTGQPSKVLGFPAKK